MQHSVPQYLPHLVAALLGLVPAYFRLVRRFGRPARPVGSPPTREYRSWIGHLKRDRHLVVEIREFKRSVQNVHDQFFDESNEYLPEFNLFFNLEMISQCRIVK